MCEWTDDRDRDPQRTLDVGRPEADRTDRNVRADTPDDGQAQLRNGGLERQGTLGEGSG